MAFPRVPEIIDMIASFLSQENNGHSEADYDTKEDIRNFRSVCKDFAAVGVRYLIPTIKIMRVREAFEIPFQIAEHSLLRSYVTRMIFYSDEISIVKADPKERHSVATAMDMARIKHFQASGQDLENILSLREALPRLKRIEIRSFSGDVSGGDRFAATIFKKIPYLCSTQPSPETAIGALYYLGIIETLVLGNSLHINQIHVPLAYFEDLRVLHIANCDYFQSSLQWIVPDTLSRLQELDYSSSRQRKVWRGGGIRTAQYEAIKGLPASLQTLRLRHIECLDESLPINLNILELSNVVLDLDAFPATLSRLSLSHVRLIGSDMTKWATLLLNLPANIELTISGCFTICNAQKLSEWLSDDTTVAYLHCKDLSDNWLNLDFETVCYSIGELLMTIIQSKSSKESPRAELLRLLFKEHNALENPQHRDLHKDAARPVSMSMYFETLYQELREGGWTSLEAPLGYPAECSLCDDPSCNYTYTGIVG